MAFDLQSYLAATRMAESGGNDTAQNRRSSASGRYQFLTPTYLQYAQQLFPGQPMQALLAQKDNPEVQEAVMAKFTQDNVAGLQKAGHEPTNGTAYLAHFMGLGGAKKALSAPPTSPVSQVMRQQALNANPHLQGKTVGDLIQWANQKGGAPGAAPQVAPQAPQGNTQVASLGQPQAPKPQQAPQSDDIFSSIVDISKNARYSKGSLSEVKGLVLHHTGGRGDPNGVVNTLNQRGLGVHYVMDREGKIFRTLPDGARGAHMRPDEVGKGLSNANTIGIEMIARDNNDLTPQQIASAQRFYGALQQKYPGLGIFGHGELNKHKQATEAMAAVEAIRNGQKPGDPAVLQAMRAEQGAPQDPTLIQQAMAQAQNEAPQESIVGNEASPTLAGGTQSPPTDTLPTQQEQGFLAQMFGTTNDRVAQFGDALTGAGAAIMAIDNPQGAQALAASRRDTEKKSQKDYIQINNGDGTVTLINRDNPSDMQVVGQKRPEEIKPHLLSKYEEADKINFNASRNAQKAAYFQEAIEKGELDLGAFEQATNILGHVDLAKVPEKTRALYSEYQAWKEQLRNDVLLEHNGTQTDSDRVAAGNQFLTTFGNYDNAAHVRALSNVIEKNGASLERADAFYKGLNSRYGQDEYIQEIHKAHQNRRKWFQEYGEKRKAAKEASQATKELPPAQPPGQPRSSLNPNENRPGGGNRPPIDSFKR